MRLTLRPKVYACSTSDCALMWREGNSSSTRTKSVTPEENQCILTISDRFKTFVETQICPLCTTKHKPSNRIIKALALLQRRLHGGRALAEALEELLLP